MILPLFKPADGAVKDRVAFEVGESLRRGIVGGAHYRQCCSHQRVHAVSASSEALSVCIIAKSPEIIFEEPLRKGVRDKVGLYETFT